MGGFTKGRWTAKSLGGAFDEPRWVILREDRSSGGVHMRRLDERGDFDKADAVLIASAPDLLEALESARAWIDFCKFAVGGGVEVLKEIDKAIARARGIEE